MIIHRNQGLLKPAANLARSRQASLAESADAIYIYIYMCMYMDMYVYIYMCIYVCTHIYICMYR